MGGNTPMLSRGRLEMNGRRIESIEVAESTFLKLARIFVAKSVILCFHTMIDFRRFFLKQLLKKTFEEILATILSQMHKAYAHSMASVSGRFNSNNLIHHCRKQRRFQRMILYQALVK